MPDDDDQELMACAVNFDTRDLTADADIDDLVLTASVDQSDEKARAARLAEYKALFPDG